MKTKEQKVEELVLRKAKTMYYQHVTSGFKWENEGQWFRDRYLSYARELLNDPDLAIKGDRGFIYLVDLINENNNG